MEKTCHEKRFANLPSIPDFVNDHLGKLKPQTSSFSFAFSLLRGRSVTMIWLLESKSRLEPALVVKHTGKEQMTHAFVSSKAFLNESCTLNWLFNNPVLCVAAKATGAMDSGSTCNTLWTGCWSNHTSTGSPRQVEPVHVRSSFDNGHMHSGVIVRWSLVGLCWKVRASVLCFCDSGLFCSALAG